MTRPLLQMQGIRHAFKAVEVLRGVDFDLYPGEIHALVGERKSGKSTLVRILSGGLRKQAGRIFLEDRELSFLTPRSALRHKIGIIYQQLNVIPSLNVVENVFSGHMPHFFISPGDKKEMEGRCLRMLEDFDLELDIHSPVGQLPETQQQLVELLRLFSLDLRILIFDETASRRTPAEMSKVFRILRRMKAQGRGIIYISTNVDEILQLADRVTVLQNGLRKSTERVQDLDRLRLLGLAYSFSLNQEQGRDPSALRLTRISEEIIQNLPTGTLLIDAEGRVELSNLAAEKIVPGDVPITFRKLRLEEVLEALRLERAEEVLEAFEERSNAVWDRLGYAQGKQVRLKISALEDEQEGYQGAIIFMDDVSLDLVVREHLSRADQVASVVELAAGVAHEINNPLAIISNYVELLKEPKDEEERLEHLSRVERELGRIVEIVQGLLSFSRVSQDAKKRLNLGRLVEEVLVLLSHKLSQKHIQVIKTLPEHPVIINGVENKLKQLFINLLANAQEAVLDRGRLELGLSGDPEASYAEVQITDNGCGIPKEIDGQIFTPFFTTKLTRTNTGLGLSICQHIAELHNGIITFKSEPGRTTFTVRLPV